MRKTLLFVVVCFLLLIFAGPVMAFPYDYVHEIDAKDVFNQDKLVRNFTIAGRTYEDVSIVSWQDGVFELVWFSERGLTDRNREGLNEEWPKSWSQEKIDNTVDDAIANWKKSFVFKNTPSGMWWWPRIDIISINGEPWQHSVYADEVIRRVERIANPDEPLGNQNSEAWEMFMDPRTNGAAIVWYEAIDPYYKNVRPENRELEYADPVSKYNPLNKGKPFDFSQWTSGKKQQTEVNLNQGAKEIKEPAAVDADYQAKAVPAEPKGTAPAMAPSPKQTVTMTINSKQVNFADAAGHKTGSLDAAPQARNGRTLIPLRGILDQLDYELNYDSREATAIIKGAEGTINLPIGRKTALVNQIEVELDQPAILEAGRTLVPLRFVSENLGFQVDYLDGTITISK